MSQPTYQDYLPLNADGRPVTCHDYGYNYDAFYTEAIGPARVEAARARAARKDRPFTADHERAAFCASAHTPEEEFTGWRGVVVWIASVITGGEQRHDARNSPW